MANFCLVCRFGQVRTFPIRDSNIGAAGAEEGQKGIYLLYIRKERWPSLSGAGAISEFKLSGNGHFRRAEILTQ